MTKISIKLTKRQIEALEDFYMETGYRWEETIQSLIEAFRYDKHFLTSLMKNHKYVPRKERLLLALLEAIEGYYFLYQGLVGKVLEVLECKGHYILNDMTIDIEKNEIILNFEQCKNSKLRVSSFGVNMKGLIGYANLIAVGHIDEELYEKMKDELEEARIKYSEDIDEHLESYDADYTEIHIFDETIMLTAAAEDVGYLPTIPKISKLFGKIIGYAKMKYRKRRK